MKHAIVEGLYVIRFAIGGMITEERQSSWRGSSCRNGRRGSWRMFKVVLVGVRNTLNKESKEIGINSFLKQTNLVKIETVDL